MLLLRGFGDEEITALSMNNYFIIKIVNKSFRNLTKIFRGLAYVKWKTTTISLIFKFVYNQISFRNSQAWKTSFLLIF